MLFEVLEQSLLLQPVPPVLLQPIENSLFVQMDHFERYRLLRELDQAACFVKAVQLVPLSEKLLKLATHVQL